MMDSYFMNSFKYLLLLLLFLVLTSCRNFQDQNAGDTGTAVGMYDRATIPVQNTEPLASKTAIFTSTITATSTPIPPTATITPTFTSTPVDLTTFSSQSLRSGILPATYIEDVCIYLENKWGEGKSEPGTIVVPIMFHSVAKPGRNITDHTTISMERFEYFMARAKELGFSTITTQELIGFLYYNEKIPQKSLLIIQDDRSPGVTELFMPYLEEYDWTLTLAWPTTALTGDDLWARMENLADSGRLDVQSHGHDHIYIQDYTPLEEIEEEIYKPIDIIQQHFGTRPETIIWPGGNFTEKSIELAEEAGFKLGFSVFSNGPIMYNWIPLRQEQIIMNAPLMVLPRYWSPAADVALDHALAISQDAMEYAESIEQEEMDYFSTYCQPEESD
jgi:peptidoglycan/xylan/chitin deacetylase (PgdA/CDA1 family)